MYKDCYIQREEDFKLYRKACDEIRKVIQNSQKYV